MSMFSSRPPFNDDPTPLVHPSGKRTPAFSYHFEYEPDESGPYGKIARATFDPRPEFDRPQHNPTNPILYAAREDIVTWVDRAAAYEWWAADFDLAPDIPEQRHPEHVDHARRVLTRLANLTKEETA